MTTKTRTVSDSFGKSFVVNTTTAAALIEAPRLTNQERLAIGAKAEQDHDVLMDLAKRGRELLADAAAEQYLDSGDAEAFIRMAIKRIKNLTTLIANQKEV